MSLPETVLKGSDCQFIIKQWNDTEKTDPVNLTEYEEIIVYLYSSPTDIKKFSSIADKTGYTALIQDSEYQFSGILSGAITREMKSGWIKIEVWTKDANSLKQIVSTIIYNLVDNQIKKES